MKLAIQENLLPGDSALRRLENARALGLDGVEYDAGGLGPVRLPEIAAALQAVNMQASAVYVGGVHLIHPDYEKREAAIVQLRQAMTDALDLGARGTVFMPHRADTPRLPDLRPLKTPVELEVDLLVKQLKTTLSDLAYALGAELYLAPRNRYETHLVRRMEQAAVILSRNKNHPHIKIAADLFHAALEESDLSAALTQHAAQTGYVRLADHNNRLPGDGHTNFAAALGALKQAGYDGWLTIAAAPPDHDTWNMDELRASIHMLKRTITT
jgi:sugar phosphate isomerase/epimerase